MSWKSNNAFKRLANTFKRLHEKKLVYKEDFEALKTLQEIINELVEIRVKEHTLFAKIVAVNLYFGLIRYGNIKQSIKLVQSDLNISLESHISNLMQELNNQDLQKLMESKGIKFDLVQGKENRLKNNEIIKNNEKEFSNKIFNEWQFEEVKKSFEKTINEFISNPENYS